jgi:N-formylglutamate amidohydrolase
VVLGDRFGATAGHDIVDQIEAAFRNAGLRVARNMPFAGAHIVQHYGRPARRQHAIQVEINRGLYMNEATLTQRADFDAFRDVIGQAIAQLSQIGRAKDLPVAAE